MTSVDAGLGQSAETAAGKMRYQMSRLRTLAANFQLQKEASLGRHAQAITLALHPDGILQERVHGAAYYFARHGTELKPEILGLKRRKHLPRPHRPLALETGVRGQGIRGSEVGDREGSLEIRSPHEAPCPIHCAPFAQWVGEQ